MQMWGNTAISSLNVLFDHRCTRASASDSCRARIQSWKRRRNKSFVRNAANAIEADHYALNLPC